MSSFDLKISLVLALSGLRYIILKSTLGWKIIINYPEASEEMLRVLRVESVGKVWQAYVGFLQLLIQ